MIQLVWNSYNLLKWTDAIANANTEPMIAGRRVSSLTYYLLIGGSATGVLVTIISGITTEYFKMGYGIILTLTNIIGAYSIKQLYLKRNLESNNSILHQNIQSLASQAEFKKENNRQLLSNKNELDATIEDYKKTQENEQERLRSLTEQISELTLRLQASEQKLAKLTSIYESFKSIVSAFINSSSTLLATEHIQENSLKNLIQTLQETNLTQATLSQEQENLTKIAQAMNAIFVCISSIPSKLQEKVNMIRSGFDQSLQENLSIKKQTDHLKSICQATTEKIAKMKIEEKKLQQKVDELRDIMSKRIPSHQELGAYIYQLRINKELKETLKI